MSLADVPALPFDVPASLFDDGASAANLYVAPVSGARILTVGQGEEYQTIAAAIAASQDGDVIEVQAGTYVDDTADITDNITIVGVGGMVNLVATQPLSNEKGIFITDASVTVANVTFSGAEVPDSEGANGAGIRYQGGDLTLINDVFTGNQNGILGGPVDGLASNTVTIENCSFANNGVADPGSAGYGKTHDMYIGEVTQFTLKNSVVLGVAGVGNDVKSRAESSDIEGNVISDLQTEASYTIDLPNGGADTIAGNFIEQGPNSPNTTIVDYSAESLPYAGSSLTITGNTVVNQSTASGSLFLWNSSSILASVSGNSISGLSGAQVASGPVQETGNVDGSGQALPDVTNTTQLSGPNNIVFTDSLAHTVTLTSSSNGGGVEGGGGLLIIYAYAGHLTVIGGSGGLDFIEEPGMGGSQITTAPGATDALDLSGQDTVYSQGSDTIYIGAGNVGATIAGTATVFNGTGNSSFLVTGSATVCGGGGSDVFSVGQGASLRYIGMSAALQATSVGATMAIDATIGGVAEQAEVRSGSVQVQSYSGALNFRTAGGTLGSSIHLGAGAMMIQSFAADTIYAGSGPLVVQFNTAGATVYAGTGALSVFGRALSGLAYFYGNGGDYTIDGDTGNIVYYGGSLDSTVEAVLNNLTLNGGSGHLTINGGGRDTIKGGSGGITVNGGAADTITTASGSTNTLMLAGSCQIESCGKDTIDLGSSNQVLTVLGDATITGSGNNTISLLGTDTLTATGGGGQITVGAGADATIVSAGSSLVIETDAVVKYTADGGGDDSSVSVTGGYATIVSTAGAPGVNVQTGSGTSTQVTLGTGQAFVAACGNDTILGGSGPDTVVVSADGAVVRGGAGTMDVLDEDWTAGHAIAAYGGSGSLSLADYGPGAITFIGGSGDATINGYFGKLSVTGGSGQISVINGSGGLMTFVAGSGTATIQATPSGASIAFGSGSTTVTEASWGAADTYECLAGHGGGQDVISGFRVGVDTVQLSGVSVTAASLSNGVASFTLSDTTSITLTNIVGTLPANLATLL